MKYRRATMDDADNLLRWKNQSDTRKFAIVHKNKIRKSDHHNWLKKALSRKSVQIWIIEEAGMIRIQGKEIAIGIGKESYGRGISTRAVNHFKRRGMVARIVDGNVASMRLFIKCGFKPLQYKKGYYIFGYGY